MKNLREWTIWAKMPIFIGYSRKCNMRNANQDQTELSNITFCRSWIVLLADILSLDI